MPEYEDHTDKELLRLMSTDDEAAFTELYGRYWKTLFLTARSILHDGPLAEDIVQEVFISIWRRRGELDIGSPRAYLQQATRFRVLKAIRAGKADADFYNRLSQVSRDILSDNPVLFKELQHLLQALMNSLPEDQQTIFRMNRDEDFTYKEIAGKLGISVKTVEKKMSRSLSQIRSGLDDMLPVVIAAH
ncbi:MAG TPA: RNA polymerase sigma-70 factor, partial [Anseongella sp.]|nr:RNA polymerase sigma-70 factor [Anseongella sp.]